MSCLLFNDLLFFWLIWTMLELFQFAWLILDFPNLFLDFPHEGLRKARPWSQFTGFFSYCWGVTQQQMKIQDLKRGSSSGVRTKKIDKGRILGLLGRFGRCVWKSFPCKKIEENQIRNRKSRDKPKNNKEHHSCSKLPCSVLYFL